MFCFLGGRHGRSASNEARDNEGKLMKAHESYSKIEASQRHSSKLLDLSRLLHSELQSCREPASTAVGTISCTAAQKPPIPVNARRLYVYGNLPRGRQALCPPTQVYKLVEYAADPYLQLCIRYRLRSVQNVEQILNRLLRGERPGRIRAAPGAGVPPAHRRRACLSQ